MMKIERSSKEYGGGNGMEIFQSEMFRVVVWDLNGGVRTNIASRLYSKLELEFDGRHEFNTDDLCMEQLTCKEIMQIMDAQKRAAFSDGEMSKAREIMRCFDGC